MKIYRVAKNKFIDDLSGEGARLYGGRWNRAGDAMVYFSEHLSLCVLEILARTQFEFLHKGYSYLEVEIPDDLVVKLAAPIKLFQHWNIEPPNIETQQYGSQWLKSNTSIALSVPSAILFEESNILLNPNHELFSEVKILKQAPLILDPRIVG